MGAISTTSDLKFWLNANTITGVSNNSPISDTGTLVGSDNINLVQPTVANQPKYLVNYAKMNNRPVVYGDGDDYFQLPDDTTTQARINGLSGFTIFIACYIEDTPLWGGSIIARDRSANRGWNCYLTCIGNVVFTVSKDILATSTRNAQSPAIHRPIVLTFRSAINTEQAVWVNGKLENGRYDGGFSPTYSPYGEPFRVFGSGYDEFVKGAIGQIAMFGRALTDTERAAIEADLMDEYVPPRNYENFINGNSLTTLSAGINGTQTTITVADASVLPSPNYRIRIQDELMVVRKAVGNTLTVVRGVENTASISHVANVSVNHTITAGAMEQWRQDSVNYQPLSNRPAAGNEGAMFIPNDAPYLFRDNGTSWDAYGPIFPLKRVDVSGYTFAESSSGYSTVINNPNGLLAYLPPATIGAVQWYKTLNWRYATVCGTWHPRASEIYRFGLIVRDSTTGSFKSFAFEYYNALNGMIFNMIKWNNITSVNAGYYTFNFQLPKIRHIPCRRIYLRIRNYNSTIFFEYSTDSYHWLGIDNVGLTDFCGADQIGFFCTNENTGQPQMFNILHYIAE